VQALEAARVPAALDSVLLHALAAAARR
jgi:hypothetical protein